MPSSDPPGFALIPLRSPAQFSNDFSGILNMRRRRRLRRRPCGRLKRAECSAKSSPSPDRGISARPATQHLGYTRKQV